MKVVVYSNFSRHMFSNVDIAELLKKAEDNKIIDRQHFWPIFNTVLQFATQRKMIISSPKLLLEDKDSSMSQIKLWSINALKDANDLTNLLYSKHTNIIQLRTIIPYRAMLINVMARALIEVFNFPIIRGVNMIELFPHFNRKLSLLRDEHNITLLDPEIELIEVYHNLYSPYPKDWDKNLVMEEQLWNYVSKRYGITSNTHVQDRTNVQGGKKHNRPKSSLNTQAIDVGIVRRIIFDHLSENKLGVLIGYWAVAAVAKHQIWPLNEKLQLLAYPEITSDAMLEQLNNILRDYTQLKLNYRQEELLLPKDYWIQKHSFFYSVHDKNLPILDIFNSLTYEIVPTWTNVDIGIELGNPYVICRFLLVDRWVFNIIKGKRLLSDEILAKKIKRIFSSIAYLRSMTKLCFSKDYIGTHKEKNIATRLLVRQQDVIFKTYHPQDYQETHGHLRIINNVNAALGRIG